MTVSFAERLIVWQRRHGRHDLPWQVTNPYFVWLSEVMLQQTQVVTVIPYFFRFIERFPDVASLAAASQDDVLAAWSGLGYYSRARNLHRAAQLIMSRFSGAFPSSPVELIELPGVGRSTAAAIATFSFGARAAILDGNVKRVLTRWAGIPGWPGELVVENRLWQLAESLLPPGNVETYTQGLMDLGSLICTRSKPSCGNCPLATDCVALATDQQAVLPTSKSRKTLPERHVVLLMIRYEDQILLERRPPAGIWGGLWSLPETTDTLSAAAICRQRFGIDIEFEPAAADFIHVFTHFRLTIMPLTGWVQHAISVADTQTDWFSLIDAQALGLPAPVRRLLDLMQ